MARNSMKEHIMAANSMTGMSANRTQTVLILGAISFQVDMIGCVTSIFRNHAHRWVSDVRYSY